jgi:hypothetical protein
MLLTGESDTVPEFHSSWIVPDTSARWLTASSPTTNTQPKTSSRLPPQAPQLQAASPSGSSTESLKLRPRKDINYRDLHLGLNAEKLEELRKSMRKKYQL